MVPPPPPSPKKVFCDACQRDVWVPSEPDDECVEPNPVAKKDGLAKLGDEPATREDGLRHWCKRRPKDAGPPFEPPENVTFRGRRG